MWHIVLKIKTNFESTLKNKRIKESLDSKYLTDIWIYAKHLCYANNVSSQHGQLRSYMYIFPFLVEGGTEGICRCTEEHEINYEYNDEQNKFLPCTGKSGYMNDSFVFCFCFLVVSPFFFIFPRIYYNVVYCILLLLTHVLL